jgi:hypothetical protein
VRYVVDLEAVGEVPNAGSAGIVWRAVGVGDDYYSMASVNEFLPASSVLVTAYSDLSHANRLESCE